jgi:hypothetical protein
MRALLVAAGAATILGVFWDAFETLILPRRVSRRLRLAAMFFRVTWAVWARGARRVRDARHRETYLSFYGPLSLLLLIVVWAFGMIVGFALLQAGAGRLHPAGSGGFGTVLYLSASTFFTLGPGDVVPASSLSRAIAGIESGAGFGFLALVIAYLPVLYQAFSRREVSISLLDERAGSPPAAGELLGRRGASYHETGQQFLRDWELWAAELMESHLSYPVLGYFRSQHENQSWVAALTTILDACALVLATIDSIPPGQAQLTFAMARHAAVDLAVIFGTPPTPPAADRLPPEDVERLRARLEEGNVAMATDADAIEALTALRASYEPYVHALSLHLRMSLPAWLPAEGAPDNWEVTAWSTRRIRRLRRPLPTVVPPDPPPSVTGRGRPPAIRD